MNPLDATREIVQLLHQRHELRSARVREYMEFVIGTCQKLVDANDVDSDATLLLVERLRCIYSDISSVLENERSGLLIDAVLGAVCAARIYYWARLTESGSAEQMLRILREKPKGPVSKDLLVEAVRRLVQTEQPGPEDVRQSILEVRRGCLFHIAYLEAIWKALGERS